jgi:SAM-dependent methyltransferase
MSNFHKYSAYYDLLYRDKDHPARAAYVAGMIRAWVPAARTILEFGCGTGRHARLLAELGFAVHGIERSAEKVAMAQREGGFTCELGDICTTRLARTFDAVMAVFHVVSYQTTDDALRATFAVAANHLNRAGIFLFDVWHGPAVLSQLPQERIKEVADARRRVRRSARPELDEEHHTVKVTYHIECEDTASGQSERFSEEQMMRYLFPAEVEALASATGLRLVHTEEFLTARAPSTDTWSVLYALQRM